MNKFKIRALFLFAFLAVAGKVGVEHIEKTRVFEIENSIEENGFLIGKYGSIDNGKDLSELWNKVVDDNHFVFVSIKDDHIPKKKLNKMKDSGVNVGLIVSPTDCTYASIYKTIDKVKEIVSDYSITYPILYDITNLMSGDVIRANCLLAEEFCNKLTANGCYVGLYGSESDMKKFSSKFSDITGTNSIDLYDKMISLDKDNSYASDYEGSYTMVQLSNGVVLCSYDLASIIKDNKLNSSSSFIPEFRYVVQKGDCLGAIANDYQIKVDDLADYNNIFSNDKIQVGDNIIIPNNYTNLDEKDIDKDVDFSSLDISSEALNSLVKGIDVSEYQGDIDWADVSSSVDFVILRLCDFYNSTDEEDIILDNKFLFNMNACELFNIPVGVYYFSRATTVEEARKEALFVADKLKSYSLEYPVYMDCETKELNQLMKNDPKSFEDIVDASMEVLEGQGYFSGIYCNKSYFDNISHLSDRYSFWLTSNESYGDSVSFDRFSTKNFPILYIPNNKQSMYQHSSKGTVNGIDGDVDINYSVKTLQKVIHDGGFDKPKE